MNKKEKNCKSCGSEIKLHFSKDIVSRLKQKQYCFSCDFWDDKKKLMQKNPSDYAVYNGVLYFIGYPVYTMQEGKYNGCGGALFEMVFRDGTKKESNNVWILGSIPETFKSEFPENVEYMKESGRIFK